MEILARIAMPTGSSTGRRLLVTIEGVEGPHFEGAPDAIKDQLTAAFPGWLVWYVPEALSGHVTWHAQRLPRLEIETASDLAVAMAEVEGRGVPYMVTVTQDQPPPNGPNRLAVLDRMRTELRITFPDWHITYTPHSAGSLIKRVVWHGAREPILHAYRPGELTKDIWALSVGNP